jgi:outer membrane protein OmpA-like peptidoglycan-associated protein
VAVASVVGVLGAWSVVRVEGDLTGRTRSALQAAGLRVGVDVDGRDAVVDAGSGSRAELERAAAVVAALPGVRTVRIGGTPWAGAGAPGGPAPGPATGTPPTGTAGTSAAPDLVVRFGTGDVALAGGDRTALDALAERVRADQRLRIRVAGHADARGGGSANLRLSRERAGAVVAYLVAAGVPAERLTAEAYGDTRPVAGNDTARGRALNRRVELVLQEGG